jgi:hypothetical protein
MTTPTKSTGDKPKLFRTRDGKNYAFIFVLICSLFLLWRFAHALLDVLNKHFQNSLEVTKAQSGCVQAAMYGGYFLMALPAGIIARRYGQQNVTHMDVFSNVKGIVTGANLAGGNIEFWPNNYTQANSANVPNASSATFDFGDQPVDPVDGYGSMQVHNHAAGQTVFALNHWREGSRADLGIGNAPGDNPDWTFTGNAGTYTFKHLRILVRCK